MYIGIFHVHLAGNDHDNCIFPAAKTTPTAIIMLTYSNYMYTSLSKEEQSKLESSFLFDLKAN